MEIDFKTLTPWQDAAINNPYKFFYMCGGIASLKTFAGSHFIIDHVLKYPHLTGLIGANSFDQLSQATLRELFFHLNEYGFEFVIDCIPPDSWGCTKDFKKYQNILSVRNPWTNNVSHIFTRTLSDADPLRGIELSYVWLDEIRDTKEYAFDVVISRLREDAYSKVLVTSSPNGEDWSFKRFVKGDRSLYGSMHIETYESVKAGIITEEFYNSLLKSYSPQLAAQELFAKHVNVGSGRAYHSAGDWNKSLVCPWTKNPLPDPDEPLIVGMDFNYSPAPLVWMIGQMGVMQIGGEWQDCIHWFAELVEKECSTEDMTQRLTAQYPHFFYRVFGDASGTKGSTSNQGETDYIQMANVFNRYHCNYSLDVDQSNPRVKNRVENMNRLFKNGLGHVRQTYNPNTCPMFDADLKLVGWRSMTNSANLKGKLDDGGDKQRTHASDGAGYAAWKLFPLAQTVELPGNVKRRFVDY